ncbi:MAG: Gfo/Idh/MocA family oxidoreductase, partial [Endomicrobiales bacterium]
MKKTIKAGIVGVTGYTGEELLKILVKHKGTKVAALAGRSSSEARPLREIYPHLGHLDLVCESLDVPAMSKKVDVVFLALPHRLAFEIVPPFLEAGIKVIDLSADFRLKSAPHYEKWYGEKHTAASLLAEAVYGLPEIYRERIRKARLVANPGC